MLINFSILARTISSVDIKHSLASINKNATPRKGECNKKNLCHANQNIFVNSVKSKQL